MREKDRKKRERTQHKHSSTSIEGVEGMDGVKANEKKTGLKKTEQNKGKLDFSTAIKNFKECNESNHKISVVNVY